jgi:hypothetical protein
MRIPLVFLLFVLLTSCDADLCGNELVTEAASPDGRYIATIFERDCGATTPHISVVSLRLSGARFDPEEDKDWVFTIHGQSDVKVLWVADRNLKITYSGTGDQPTQRRKWKDVTVSYE